MDLREYFDDEWESQVGAEVRQGGIYDETGLHLRWIREEFEHGSLLPSYDSRPLCLPWVRMTLPAELITLDWTVSFTFSVRCIDCRFVSRWRWWAKISLSVTIPHMKVLRIRVETKKEIKTQSDVILLFIYFTAIEGSMKGAPLIGPISSAKCKAHVQCWRPMSPLSRAYSFFVLPSHYVLLLLRTTADQNESDISRRWRDQMIKQWLGTYRRALESASHSFPSASNIGSRNAADRQHFFSVRKISSCQNFIENASLWIRVDSKFSSREEADRNSKMSGNYRIKSCPTLAHNWDSHSLPHYPRKSCWSAVDSN